MNLLNKLKNIFCKDYSVEDNEDGGKSYEVNVQSGVREVSSENG